MTPQPTSLSLTSITTYRSSPNRIGRRRYYSHKTPSKEKHMQSEHREQNSLWKYLQKLVLSPSPATNLMSTPTAHYLQKQITVESSSTATSSSVRIKTENDLHRPSSVRFLTQSVSGGLFSFLHRLEHVENNCRYRRSSSRTQVGNLLFTSAFGRESLKHFILASSSFDGGDIHQRRSQHLFLLLRWQFVSDNRDEI